MKKTYWIFDENKVTLEDKLRAAWRKAMKLGLPAPEFRYTGKEKFENVSVPGQSSFVAKMVEIEINGEAPHLAGWQFAATIQHTDNGNIIRGLNSIEIPPKYRTIEPVCDHCQTKRYRVDTYIIFNKNEDRFAQVGSSCLKDFLGGIDPHNAAWLATFLADIDEFAESLSDPENYGGKFYFNTLKYMTFVALALRLDGWMSKANAQEANRLPTAEIALDMMFSRGKWSDFDAVEPSDNDIELAESALKWVREEVTERPNNNDYMHNLTVATASNYITTRETGLVASAIPAYQREIAKKLEDANSVESQWVGDEKKRQVFKVKCLSIFPVNTDWGVLNIHRLADEAGNTLVWKTTSDCLEQGVWYEGKATVKAHDTWGDRNEKQTVLTRCKFEEVEQG